MSFALLISSNFIVWPALLAAMFGRITRTQSSGIVAIGCIPSIVAFVLDGTTSSASVFAALGAINAWIWWQGGGGDGTRRRLKSWGRRFQGVRRTAPSHT
ncbi:hypothetical protein [Streptomyces leeuwenhoekii]|uniref:Sle1_068 protein n=1 Tax=Streptomyces leeuwenhoekii TaxID=1437453 RepID=A0A0F7VL12_STRLW|nr:hypothetical protein [Streptomyces leeuwenhoekii]CQR59235.1 sle1_068 [Streptomyces leeuwenhoekii]